MPQTSIIGRLLNHKENITILKSTQTGIMQHDLYSWQVLGEEFVKDELTNSSEFIDRTITNWLKEVSPEQWKVGDVITYTLLGSTRVTHRIVEIDEVKRQVITKGDANDSVDGTPVPFDNIVGRVAYHAPLLGYISIYGKTPTGIAILCGMVLLLVIFNFLPDRKMHLYDQNVTGL